MSIQFLNGNRFLSEFQFFIKNLCLKLIIIINDHDEIFFLKSGKTKTTRLSCYFKPQYVSLIAGGFVFAEELIFE